MRKSRSISVVDCLASSKKALLLENLNNNNECCTRHWHMCPSLQTQLRTTGQVIWTRGCIGMRLFLLCTWMRNSCPFRYDPSIQMVDQCIVSLIILSLASSLAVCKPATSVQQLTVPKFTALSHIWSIMVSSRRKH